MLFIKRFKYLQKNTDLEYLLARTKWEARKNLLLYRQKTQDKLLDAYLRQNYKVDLLHLCLQIIAKARFMSNTSGSNEITIIIPDKYFDKLAALITYGNMTIKGSNILRHIFN